MIDPPLFQYFSNMQVWSWGQCILQAHHNPQSKEPTIAGSPKSAASTAAETSSEEPAGLEQILISTGFLKWPKQALIGSHRFMHP